MATFLLAVLFILLGLGVIGLRRLYQSIPLFELKRHASEDDAYNTLYQAVSYGDSLQVLLWLLIILFMGLGVALLSATAPFWLALILVLLIIWVAFVWLPVSRISDISGRLSLFVTPAIVWVLVRFNSTLQRGVKIFSRHPENDGHTGLFELEDLKILLSKQQHQSDNRITKEALEVANRALRFNEYTVQDILIPRTSIASVTQDDMIGPVLIDDLHKFSERFALVREWQPDGPISGLLDINRLGIHSEGLVRDIMNPTVYYLHEQDTLADALHAFFVTNSPVFAIVNSFEEYVGIITVENMVKQLLGHVPGDAFDQYANLSAVAARHAGSQVQSIEEPGIDDEQPKDEPEINEEIIEEVEVQDEEEK